jgi:hypothetical protein
MVGPDELMQLHSQPSATRVAFIPIEPNPPPLELVAARLKGEPPPAVAAFLDMVRDQIEGISTRLSTALSAFVSHQSSSVPISLDDRFHGSDPFPIEANRQALESLCEMKRLQRRLKTR